MAQRVVYEWIVEELDPDNEDEIVDTQGWDTAAEAVAFAAACDSPTVIGLCRHEAELDQGGRPIDEVDRSYAYVIDGELAAEFEEDMRPTPKRFHVEWRDARNNAA